MKKTEKGYRDDVADALWLRQLKSAAANGPVAELRRLERTLHDAIGRLEGHLSGEHAQRDNEHLQYLAREAALGAIRRR